MESPHIQVEMIDGQMKGDNGADQIRIQIWNGASGAVLYDNQFLSKNDAALSNETIVQGGNISIHPGNGSSAEKAEKSEKM